MKFRRNASETFKMQRKRFNYLRCIAKIFHIDCLQKTLLFNLRNEKSESVFYPSSKF